MSGIQTGSRLERLYGLRAQVAQEIAVLEREAALVGGLVRAAERPPAAPVAVTAPVIAPEFEDVKLDDLGVTAYQVKEWALDAGLVDEIKPGRVGNTLVRAYAEAHVMVVAE